MKFAFSLLIFLSVSALVIWFQGKFVVANMISSGAVTDITAIEQLRLLNSIVGKTMVLGLAVTFGLALFLSHYIAGPLYRFEKVLEEMRGGNLTVHVKLRKNDELKEVADGFNQAIAGLRSKLQIEREAVKASLDKGKTLASKLREAGRTDEAVALEALLHDLETRPMGIRIS